MDILHVETGRQFLGGPQQVIYLITALIEQGHGCTLVCPPGSGIDSAARLKGMPVRNLFCAGDLDLPFAYRLAQYLKSERPDLIHCHSRRGADMLGGLAASFTDIPAVVSRRVDNTEMRVLAALRYRPFAKIIAISDAVADALCGQGVAEDRIEVIRSAVDTAAFAGPTECSAFRAAFGLPGDATVVAAAGQLVERKGHRFLLDAVAGLRERHPMLRVVIFGAGELEAALRTKAAELGIDDIVTFAGFREDLDELLGCVDILAHPALAEGLGVVTLKAAAAGVPVVGFEAGGLSEAVSNGETGLLVPPRDTAALSAALDELLSEPSLREQLGAAGRERMQNEFSIATMTAKHVALYESVLDA